MANVAEGDLRGLDAPDNIRMAQNLAEEAQQWLGPLVQLGNDGEVKLNLAKLLQMSPADLEAKMAGLLTGARPTHHMIALYLHPCMPS